MPPKKDKALDNDFTNLHLLPKAHIFKFQIAYNSFFSQANRDKVVAKVQESLVGFSGERVKILSREDITAYGKGKAMVLDNAAAMALPEDNALHGLPTEELFAKCAADKLFEMTVQVRRFKKERITKIEEEAATKAAAGATEEAAALEAAAQAATDEFDLDAMFYLSDYPSNKAEALAFAKYSNSLNGVFKVQEQPRPINPDDEEEVESEERDEDEEMDEDRSVSRHEDQVVLSDGAADNGESKTDADNQEERDRYAFLIDELETARNVSSKDSPLRQMAFLNVPFIDEAVITEEPGVDSAEPVEKKQPSEEVFLGDLITQHLDKFGQFYVQYLKFREVVTAEPLMPDQRALAELAQLNEEENIYLEQKQENEGQMDEDQNAFNLEKEQLQGDELDQAEAEFAEIRAQFEAEANAALEESKSRRDRMGQLQWRKKASVDEERNFEQFSTTAYKNDFVENNETSNKISSVLSAMITQIEANPEQKDSTIPQGRALGSVRGAGNESALTMDDSNLDDLFEHFNREISCDLRLASRDRDAPPTENQTVRLASTYNKGIELHEESDKTLEVKQNLPLKLVEDESDRVQTISDREHQVLSNLNLPGKNRFLMPGIPAKSKRMRDAENPSFYPFCTLSHDEAERTLMLRALQQLVRSNFIDNQQRGTEKHSKFKVFERNFENHMKPEIFKQVFAEALLDEPDVASMYYQRQDSLIVALFNKAKAQSNIPEQSSPLGDNIDGDRTWRAAYRVVPDFQNWLTFFSEELVFEQEASSVPRDDKAIITTSQPTGTNPGDTTGKTVGGFMKYQMDEDAMPERMLDIEDDKIQSLQERSGLLYPDDNSIMRVDHFSVGGQDFTKSVILKDNLRFGLRKRAVVAEESSEMYGLVSYKVIGDTEFWLQFENGTRLGVEQAILQRNGQKTVRIEPPPPTAEEIAAKEEAIKAYQAQQVKSQRSGGKVTNDIEIPKTPEPTWEEEPMNHLDELFTENMVDQTTSLATITLSNGLFVQYLGNGQVSQTTQDLIGEKQADTCEIARVCTKEGAVIRQFANRDAQVLYPDGETASFDKISMTWTIVNNKGKKRTFKDGVYRDVETIPCAHETDPDTLAVMMIREDNVVSVQYPDGGLFVQHADGTQMYTNGNDIRIEKQGLASHRVRMLSKQEQEEYEGNTLSPRIQAKTTPCLKVEERALDGRILETFLPDGAMSQTYLDEVSSKNRGFEERYRTLIKRPDLSVVLIDGSGHISVIGSNSRASLCDNGSKATINQTEQDRDYLVELSRMAGTFTPGIYQAYVSAKDGKSKIKTKNASDDKIYTLNFNDTLSKTPTPIAIKSSIGSAKSNAASGQQMPQATVIGDLEIEETGQNKNPLTRQYQYPRFFVVAGDGSAKELLSKDQLSYAMRKKKVMDEQSIKQKISDVVNNATVESHYFLTKVVNMKETELENQKLRDLEFPANASDTLEQKDQTPREDIALQVPRQEQYLYTQVFEMPDMDSFSQKAFANDYQRYQEWKMTQVRFNTEFGIIRKKHDPTNTKQRALDQSVSVDSDQIEEDEFNNKRIALKILKFRTKPNKNLEAEEFKQMSMSDMEQNKNVKSFREKCQATHSSLVSRGSQRSQGMSGQDKEKEAAEGSNQAADESEGLEEDEMGQEEREQINAQNEMVKEAKTKERVARLEGKLDGMARMKNTPSFEPEYFMSQNGNQFLVENPPKELSPEVIMRMEQRLKRQSQKESRMEGESQKGQDENIEGEQINDKDNPIVALEPEDGLKKGSAFMGSKKGQSISHQQSSMSGKRQEDIAEETFIDPSMVPSLYAQEKMYLAQKEKEELLRSEEHHIVKTKEFDHTGRLRKQMPFVKATAKSKAESELNEKFITTECITDRRVKISSMSGRHYAQAPSVEMVRKQGQHQMILGAINKKQTFAELINQANSMVTGVLHDPLKRSLNVMPSQAVFGGVRAGTHNEIIFTLKNEDSIGHRITVKPCVDKRVVIQQLEHGVIAPGMTRKISVGIRVTEDEPEGRISDQLCIVTKHETFKIPITAQVHLYENFEEADNEHRQTMGKSLQNGRVRERLLRQVTQSRQGSRQDSHPELLTKKPDEDDSDNEGQLNSDIDNDQ